ncbi:MAG: amino acid racemase, partial [Acidobacteriota bacterium]
MPTVGLIGGTGPESTIDYYRLLIASYRRQRQDGSYPSILINSIDLKRVTDCVTARRFPELTEYLLGEINRLARAGAAFGALTANTPHIVFDDLQRQSPIPLLSIVEVACVATKSRGMKLVGLFGTRFTMEGQFYQDVFNGEGITLVVPAADEQAYIHDRYMNELINGIFLPETRAGLLQIAERMRVEDGIEGLILGGTELPLILKEA